MMIQKNRISWLMSLFCLFLIIPTTAAAQKQASAASYIQQHVENVQKQQNYLIGSEPVLSRILLPPLYSDNQFQPLWQNQDSVNQLLHAIQESELEGLTPADYHQKSLTRLQQQKAGMNSPSLQADYDLLLTDACIRLAYDKKFGKVDPQQLNSDWNLPEKKIGKELVQKIEKNIARGTVDEALLALSPRHEAYEHLKKALAEYRTIKANGGWPTIAAGPVLKPGIEDARIPSLRKRLRLTDQSPGSADFLLFDEQLKQAVIRFQQRHYIDADGVVGKHTLETLNQSVDQKIDQIRVNLERARWILHDIPESVILIDIAGYTLTYHHNSKVIWTTKVVVGKPYHMTPIFESSIKYLVINPTWTIPRSIIAKETLAKVQKDPGYLQKHNLRVLDSQGKTINPATINWSSYTGKSFPYYIRQEPGPNNSLGRIKFIFPNKHSVYLHDTPHRTLFNEDQRAFSHGCIRVEHPLTLGELILKNDGQSWDKQRIEKVIESKKITNVSLNTPLPVRLLYWTVKVSDNEGRFLFKQDIYGRDKALLKALDSPFRVRSSVIEQMKTL